MASIPFTIFRCCILREYSSSDFDCELNRQIRADNALIRTLKAAIATLKKAVESTIPAIAAAMETIRQNTIVFNYGLLLVWDRRKDTKAYVEQTTRKCSDYKDIRSQMKLKARERGELQKELAGLSVFAAGRRKKLKIKVAELSEEIEELQFEEKSVMRGFDKADTAGIREVEEDISKSEARLALRPQMENEAQNRIRRATGGRKINLWKFQSSVSDADKLLDEAGMAERHEE